MSDIFYNNDGHYIQIMVRSKETDGEWSYWDYLGRHEEIERRIKMEDRSKYWMGSNCRSFGMNYRENSANCKYCKDKVDCKIMSVGWGDQIPNHKNSIENPKAQLLEDMLRDLHVYFVPDESEQITIEITRGNVRVKKTRQEDLAVTI